MCCALGGTFDGHLASQCHLEVKPILLQSLFDYLEPLDADLEGDVDFGPEAAADEAEVDFAAAPAVAPPAVQPLMADVTSSVVVPGLLHIIHNASGDMVNSMASYADVVVKLKKVAQLIGSKESKDRLMQTCFNTPVGRALAGQFKSFSSFVYEERWGTVSACVLKMVPLESAVRHGWSLTQYMAGFSDHRPIVLDNDGPHNARLDIVEEAISSAYFWAYLRMLEKGSSLIMKLLSWAEGCSCHWDLHRDDAPDWLSKVWETCPLRGRRCADIAAGEFLKLVHSLADETAAGLLLCMQRDVTEQDALLSAHLRQ